MKLDLLYFSLIFLCFFVRQSCLGNVTWLLLWLPWTEPMLWNLVTIFRNNPPRFNHSAGAYWQWTNRFILPSMPAVKKNMKSIILKDKNVIFLKQDLRFWGFFHKRSFKQDLKDNVSLPSSSCEKTSDLTVSLFYNISAPCFSARLIGAQFATFVSSDLLFIALAVWPWWCYVFHLPIPPVLSSTLYRNATLTPQWVSVLCLFPEHSS